MREQRYEPNFPLDELVPHPGNPRVHDLDSIEESIEENEFAGAIYAQEGTNHILSGHGRVKALVRNGQKTAPVIFITCDDEEALKLLLAFNRVGEKSTYDKQALADILGGLADTGDLLGTGYNADDLDDLFSEVGDLELPPQETGADYVENDDEQRERAARVAQTKESVGLKEVVLVYSAPDYELIKHDVAIINEFHEASSTSEVVKIALDRYARELEKDAED